MSLNRIFRLSGDKLEEMNEKINSFTNFIENTSEKSAYDIKSQYFNTIVGVETLCIKIETSLPISIICMPFEHTEKCFLMCTFTSNIALHFQHYHSNNNLKNALILTESYESNQLNIPKNFKGVVCFFYVKSQWFENFPFSGNTNISQIFQLPHLCLLDMYQLQNLDSHYIELNLKISQLFHHSISSLYNKFTSKTDNESIEDVKHYLLENLSDKLPSAETLAKIANMSTSNLKKKFKQSEGISMKDFFLTKKMEYALTLLKSGLTMKDISHTLSYNDPSNFSHAF